MSAAPSGVVPPCRRPPPTLPEACAALAALQAVVALYRTPDLGPSVLAYCQGRPAYPGGQIHPTPCGAYVLVLGEDEDRAEATIRVLLDQERDPTVGVSVVRVGRCYKIAWTGGLDDALPLQEDPP